MTSNVGKEKRETCWFKNKHDSDISDEGTKKRESKVFANAHVWVGCHGSKLIKGKPSYPLVLLLSCRLFFSVSSRSCLPPAPLRSLAGGHQTHLVRFDRTAIHSIIVTLFFFVGELLDIRQRRCRVRSLHLDPSVTFYHIRERSLTRNLTRVAPLIATKISGEW